MTMKMSERIGVTGVGVTVEQKGRVRKNIKWLNTRYHHVELTATLCLPGREAQFPLSWVTEWGRPSPADVMESLVGMARAVETSPSYGDWADEYASDPDAILDPETYAKHVEMTLRLKEFLGSRNWEAWLHETRSD